MMSTSTTSTTKAALSMEAMFQKLESYQVPSELMIDPSNKEDDTTTTNSTTTSTNEVADQMIDEYTKRRDIYLQRKLVRNMFDYIMTHFDSPQQKIIMNATTLPPTITQEEHQALLLHQQHVLSMITNKASTIQQQRYELRNKYIHFQQKRNEFYHFMKLQQENHDPNHDDNLLEVDIENTTIEYEHYRMIQEEKIQYLHHRRAQLQVQLHQTQQQYQTTLEGMETSKVQWQQLQQQPTHQLSSKNTTDAKIMMVDGSMSDKHWVNDLDEDHLYELQQTNHQLRQKVETMNEIKDFYSNLLLLMEELHGIRFLRTTTTTTIPASNNNNSTNHNGSHDPTKTYVKVTVQLLKKYTVDITLDVTSSSSSSSNRNTNHRNNKDPNFGCIIQSAILTSDNAVVTGPPIRNGVHQNTNGDNTSNDQGTTMTTAVQLRIPHFDDIVQYVNTTMSSTSSSNKSNTTTSSGGENVRVVLREILARITMVEERVQMLTQLQQEPGVVATIGPFCTTTSTTTTMLHDQEVVCSLNDPPMTMVLRCTGNCPIMEDSIYIDQLHGIGSGWGNIPTLIHEKLQSRSTTPFSMNQHPPPQQYYRFRTPLDIIYAVRTELQYVMQQQSFVIPETPRLPFRNPPSTSTTTGTTGTRTSGSYMDQS